VQFAVGFKIQGKTGHVVVDAEDALIAALKVKMQRPEALIAYVRQQNKRGDTRHPMRRLSSESSWPPLRRPDRRSRSLVPVWSIASVWGGVRCQSHFQGQIVPKAD
jgi:hypothetical protein